MNYGYNYQYYTPGNIPPSPPKKKRKVLKIILAVASVKLVLILLVIGAIYFSWYLSYVSSSGSGTPSIMGKTYLSVQNDSMSPELMPGDLIIGTTSFDADELKVGDIITYWTVIDGERVLNTHRITAIYDGGGYLIFETKGDNNVSCDPLTVHEHEVVSLYTGSLSGVGYAADWLQSPTGFSTMVVVCLLLIFF